MEVFSVERLTQKVIKSFIDAGQMPPGVMSNVYIEEARKTVEEYIKEDREKFRFRAIWLI